MSVWHIYNPNSTLFFCFKSFQQLHYLLLWFSFVHCRCGGTDVLASTAQTA